jgi:phosphoglycerate dehydrogenase-like enzyme
MVYKITFVFPPHPEIAKIVRPLAPEGFDIVFVDSGNQAELMQHLPDTDFLITVNLNETHLAVAPKLKMVQMQGVGYDGVDRAALKARAIPLCITVPGTVGGVAEHTILMILALYKHLLEADQSVRQGRWLSNSLRFQCYLLEGKTLGLVGLGRIGREVVKRARGFDPTIVYYDVVRAAPEEERKLGVAYLPLDDLLSSADIVSVHVPLTPQTRKFLGAPEFGLMKPTAIFINTSRGPIMDEPALYQALKERRIMGAGLDVFDPEPPKADNPLFQLDNVVLSPHMATGTRDSMAQKARAAFENFQRFLRHEPLLDEVKD